MDKTLHRSRACSLIVILLLATQFASAQPLTAVESDPRVLGWMQGFPPPRDRVITQPDSVYFSFPKLRWSVCHLREFLPTEEISRGLGAPSTLPSIPIDELTSIEQAINAIEFKPTGLDTLMSWQESLEANYTDGLLILHHGRIVYEYYSGCLEEDRKHAIMSMTKSITGLLAEILVAEGRLNDSALVSTIIPEVSKSAFGSATIR